MPVVLGDEMLTPPSMRRPRHYVERERVIEVPSSQSTSTIDLPPHRVEYERPQSPLVIHQDHIIQLPQEVELFREREYVIEPAGGSVRRYYRRSGAHSETDFTRRGRARSVGYDYDSYCSTCDEEEYYIDDGTTHGFSRSVMAGHVIGGGSLVPGRRRRMRRSPGPTLGAQKLYRHHHGHQREHIRRSEEDPNRRIRHLAEAGLGIAAVGAAKELYDARARRARSRSSSLSSDGAGHKGRHIAAAALGATAAGLAVHKYAERRRRGSSSDCSSDSGRSTHRGRKVAAGLGAATAAGLAAKAIHDRHRRGSRSLSSSASSTYSADGNHRRAAAGLGGATALHRSRSRSHSRPGILRHRRSSSTFSTSSADSSSHKLRNAALGAGAVAGAAALARRAKHHRERSRSPRRRSRTVSQSRHRSSSRGALLAKSAAATVAGALAKHQIRKNHKERRARSVDEARRRHHRERGHHRYHDDSSSTHSRRESGVGGMLRRAITGGGGGHHHPHERHEGGSGYRNAAAQEMAYRAGEAAAAGVRRVSRPRQ